MLTWFRALMPKEEGFFDLFEAHAAKLLEASRALRRLLDGGEAVRRNCEKVVACEHEADAITREVLVALRRSFITPFDRSDIAALITAMDDAVDSMQHAVKSIVLFEVRSFEPGLRSMGDAIVQMAELVAQGLPLLRRVAKEAQQLTSLAEQITSVEGQVDELHENALKAAFHGTRTDPMAFLVAQQVLEGLEAVADRLDDVGNQLSSIVIEQA